MLKITGRMNAPNSPGRLAVDNFVEDEDEEEGGGGGYLAMVEGAGCGAASGAAPEPEPEPEVAAADEGDGLLALVEERASAEGSLWGPAEELGSDGLLLAPMACCFLSML